MRRRALFGRMKRASDLDKIQKDGDGGEEGKTGDGKEEGELLRWVPMGRKAQEVSTDRKEKAWRHEVGKRRGRKVTSEEFSRQIEMTHTHKNYAAIYMQTFMVENGRRERR